MVRWYIFQLAQNNLGIIVCLFVGTKLNIAEKAAFFCLSFSIFFSSYRGQGSFGECTRVPPPVTTQKLNPATVCNSED